MVALFSADAPSDDRGVLVFPSYDRPGLIHLARRVRASKNAAGCVTAKIAIIFMAMSKTKRSKKRIAAISTLPE